MRTITADLIVTLDGFALGEKSPAYFGYFGPDLEHWIHQEIAKPQMLLFGRGTYQVGSGQNGVINQLNNLAMDALALHPARQKFAENLGAG